MRYINYNIGSHKRLNYIPIIFMALTVLFISTFLIKIGIDNILFLNSKTTEKQALIDNLENYINKVSKNETNIQNGINKNRSKWEPRIKFINSLIDKKTFPYLKRFDKLEKLMPDEAYLRSITIRYGKKNQVLLNVESTSFATLIAVYKKFGKLNASMGNETEKNGKFLSTISLVMKDE